MFDWKSDTVRVDGMNAVVHVHRGQKRVALIQLHNGNWIDPLEVRRIYLNAAGTFTSGMPCVVVSLYSGESESPMFATLEGAIAYLEQLALKVNECRGEE